MRAYQCDRCGRFYSFLSKNTGKISITDTRTTTLLAKDLCDECQKELEAWWGKKKKGKKNEQKTSEETQKESTI